MSPGSSARICLTLASWAVAFFVWSWMMVAVKEKLLSLMKLLRSPHGMDQNTFWKMSSLRLPSYSEAEGQVPVVLSIYQHQLFLWSGNVACPFVFTFPNELISYSLPLGQMLFWLSWNNANWASARIIAQTLNILRTLNTQNTKTPTVCFCQYRTFSFLLDVHCKWGMQA